MIPTDGTRAPSGRAAGPAPLRVLCLASRHPYPTRLGIDVRVAWLLECLVGRGLDVRLASVAVDGSDAPAPAAVGWSVHAADPPTGSIALRWARAVRRRTPVWVLARESAALRREVATAAPDVVLCLDDASAAFLPGLPASVPVVLDKHAVLTWMAASMPTRGRPAALYAARHRLLLHLTSGFERRALERADAVTVSSTADADRLRETFGVVADAVVPSSASVSDVAWRGGGPAGVLGAMTIAPNLDGLRRFVEEAGHDVAASRVAVEVAGALPEGGVGFALPAGVQALGFVDDLPAWLSGLGCLVVPVFSGSGVKTKTVTAMAAGVPVVSTPDGVEGLAVTDGVDCLVRESPSALLAAAAELAADPARARAIGRAGRALVASGASVEVCAEALGAAITAAQAAAAVRGAASRAAGGGTASTP